MGENRRPKKQSHFAVIRTVNGHVLLVIPIYNSLKLGLLRPFSDFQTLCAFEYAAAFQVVTTSRLQLASVALKRWSCQINSQSCQLKFMVLENPSRLADLYCQFKAQSSLKLLDKSDDFNSADFQKLLTQRAAAKISIRAQKLISSLAQFSKVTSASPSSSSSAKKQVWVIFGCLASPAIWEMTRAAITFHFAWQQQLASKRAEFLVEHRANKQLLETGNYYFHFSTTACKNTWKLPTKNHFTSLFPQFQNCLFYSLKESL